MLYISHHVKQKTQYYSMPCQNFDIEGGAVPVTVPVIAWDNTYLQSASSWLKQRCIPRDSILAFGCVQLYSRLFHKSQLVD